MTTSTTRSSLASVALSDFSLRAPNVFKALALGAAGVGIGRPQGWGLAAFGQEGVEAVLDIYARELEAIMRQVGTPTIAAINARAILHRGAA